MKAIRLHHLPAGLVFEEVDEPIPGKEEVLVRVRAAAITRDELSWVED